MNIKDIMREAAALHEDEYLTKARQLIRDTHQRILPVIDERGHLLGIITDEDILKLRAATKSNVTVKGFVTSGYSVDINEDLLTVAKLMVREELDELPVVENGKLVGILNLRDVLRAMPRKESDTPVGTIMTEKVRTLSEDDPISLAASNMAEYGYSGFPVIDKKNKLVGVVTRRDLIRARSKLGKGNPPPVKRIMTPAPHTVSQDATLNEAVELMLKYDIGRLPVTENDRLLGIIDRYDLVRTVIG
ncbi:MAG: histidine kinase [Candidatus Syntrophoarchaeum caldarius]|uniref:Histidine kinase n=1 Tax=Candidatus Syntropharchaeum caldarium TaxID=1838285 RepID=A0A1F2P9T6_9EURY|nr:MAG: histidine kinase [Candidatus Syntrophoarchaeum caldarius]